jgi:hypothetical protein
MHVVADPQLMPSSTVVVESMLGANVHMVPLYVNRFPPASTATQKLELVQLTESSELLESMSDGVDQVEPP